MAPSWAVLHASTVGLVRVALALNLPPSAEENGHRSRLRAIAPPAAKRLQPTGTSYYAVETPSGRYCDRSTGLVTTWYERCVRPAVLTVDRLASASAAESARQQLAIAMFDAATPTEGETAASQRSIAASRVRRHEMACPMGSACVQAVDDDGMPLIFCKLLRQRDLPIVSDNAGSGSKLFEPFGPDGAVFEVELAQSAEAGEAPNETWTTTVSRRFEILEETELWPVFIVYDARTMQLIEPAAVSMRVERGPGDVDAPPAAETSSLPTPDALADKDKADRPHGRDGDNTYTMRVGDRLVIDLSLRPSAKAKTLAYGAVSVLATINSS